MRGARYAALRLESQDCRDHLQCIATEAGKSLGKDKRSEFCEALRGRAKRDNAKIVVHTRVAADTTNPSEHVYFLNLANDAGEIVRITPHGWYVEHNTTIAFLPDLGALPTPIQPENHKEAYEIVSHFLVEQGVAPDTVMLVIAALLEWLRPGTAYPILDILGPAGGGKTALASSIVALIDPTKSGKLTDASLEEEQLAALAQSAHIHKRCKGLGNSGDDVGDSLLVVWALPSLAASMIASSRLVSGAPFLSSSKMNRRSSRRMFFKTRLRGPSSPPDTRIGLGHALRRQCHSVRLLARLA